MRPDLMRGKRGKRPKLLFVTNDMAANRHLPPFPKAGRRRGSIFDITLIRYIFFVVRCIRTRARNISEVRPLLRKSRAGIGCFVHTRGKNAVSPLFLEGAENCA